MFQIPVKEIIVNADSQVRLLNRADGAAFTASTNITPTTGGFVFEGFLGPIASTQVQLLSGTTRILKTAASAGTQGSATYVLTTAPATCAAGTVFRLVEDTLDLTPVQYQNRPIEKRYQVSSAQTNVDGVGAAIAAAINADPNAWATVTYTAGSDTLVVTSKKVGTRIQLFSVDYALPTPTLVQGTLPIGTYDAVKNINWAKNFSIDQNINWMPLPGVSYQTVYFEVNGPVNPLNGNSPIPNELHNSTRYAVRLYVKAGLTLETAIDYLITDLNV
jgi:hypothetical protein